MFEVIAITLLFVTSIIAIYSLIDIFKKWGKQMLFTVIISVILSNISVFIILYVIGLKQEQERKKAYLNALQSAINNDLSRMSRYDLDAMGTYNDKDNLQ